MWSGVWQGTVGRADMRLCLQAQQEPGEDVAGTYYYSRYLRLIPLSAAGDPTADGRKVVLHELMPSKAKPGAGQKTPTKDETVVWQLQASADGEGLAGTWRSNAKSLPVQLSRVRLEKPKNGADGSLFSPCESDAFNLPREKPAKVVSTEVKLKATGATYQRLTLDFEGRQDARIQHFELLRTDAAAQKFNARQRQALQSDQSALFECGRAVIARWGLGGDYNTMSEPVFMGQRWLVVKRQSDDYCGGAHPNAYVGYETWNLEAGQVVDPWTWFNAKAARFKWEGSGQSRYQTMTMGPMVRQALAKVWPREDEECADVVEEGGAFSWDAYPSAKGMVFMPQLPHGAMACQEEVTLPWAQVLPWLSPSGRKTVDALRQEFSEPPAR
jgi:hypothetical protein